MRAHLLLLLLLTAVLRPDGAMARDGNDAESVGTCIGCHLFGDDSPVHPLLAGPHGAGDREGTPMAGGGCAACHGPSGAHTRAPIQVAPGVSFGPRWSATVAAQDGVCLDCHRDGAARHWKGAHHEQENLPCVTCHDAHTVADSTHSPAGQRDLCTDCHDAQRSGIHGLPAHRDDNPACSSCHAPHDGSSPHVAMLENRSEGCATCHDLVAMSRDPRVSAKASSYHKAMAQQDRTCIGCHVGVAHGSAGVNSVSRSE